MTSTFGNILRSSLVTRCTRNTDTSYLVVEVDRGAPEGVSIDGETNLKGEFGEKKTFGTSFHFGVGGVGHEEEVM